MELAHQQDLLRDETGRVMQVARSGQRLPHGPFRLPSTPWDGPPHCSSGDRPDPRPRRSEQNAIDRLKLILAAMEPEDTGRSRRQTMGRAIREETNRTEGPGGVLPLAQLKLLKLLQEDLNLRTQQLNQAEAAGKPAEELREQYARLSEEQDRLAELTFQLLRPQPPDSGEPAEDVERRNRRRKSREEEIANFRFQISNCKLAAGSADRIRRRHTLPLTSMACLPNFNLQFAICNLQFLLLFSVSRPFAAERPPSTDDQLRDSLNSRTGDDYDRALLGDPAKPDGKDRVDDEMQKKLQKELGPAAQKEDKPKDPLLQVAEGDARGPAAARPARFRRGDAILAAADRLRPGRN